MPKYQLSILYEPSSDNTKKRNHHAAAKKRVAAVTVKLKTNH